MAKYSSDKYIVTLFDDVGSRLRSEDVISYTEGRELGERIKTAGECRSYAVLRVIYNSEEPNTERYDVKSRG